MKAKAIASSAAAAGLFRHCARARPHIVICSLSVYSALYTPSRCINS